MTEYEPVQGEQKKIRALARRLRRNDPVRIAVEAVLNDTRMPPGAFEDLMDALVKPSRISWRRTLLSCWTLGFACETDQQRQAASARIAFILADRPGRKVGCLLAAGCLFAHFAALYMLYVSLVDSPINKVREAAAIALGRLKVTGAVGDLCQAMAHPSGTVSGGDKSVRLASAWSLNNILPKLVDNGYGQVPASTLAGACKLLIGSSDRITIRALTTISLAGGGSCISAVERCEKRAKNPIVKAAAEEALVVLRARQVREQAPQRLLRPSELQVTEELKLLRPVADSESDNTYLLRPHQDEDDNEQQLGNL